MGAALDRNGLRPLRYAVCEDGFVVVCSEAGAVDTSGHGTVQRGRLRPGQMLFVDPSRGVLYDHELKERLAAGSYARWAADGLYDISRGEPVVVTLARAAHRARASHRSHVRRPRLQPGLSRTTAYGAAMDLDLSADELLTTTRSVRKRLDLTRPVEREVVLECLDVALQAPTGSNNQGWQWVFVTDPAKKRAIADIYGKHFDPYASAGGASYAAGDTRAERSGAVRGSATYLREHFHEVPVMMIPCHAGRVDGAPAATQAGFWGSLLPAAWSMMLALRAKGLGSAWTTLHLGSEEEVAELLGIPYDRYTQGGLFPIAYTKGTDFKPAPRLPATDLAHWDSW